MGNVKHWLIVDATGKAYEDWTKLRLAAFTLSTMSNPIRLGILLRLSRGERQMRDLSSDLGIKATTLSGHLALLRRTGLVTAGHVGKRSCYALTEMGQETARFVKITFAIGDVRRQSRHPLV